MSLVNYSDSDEEKAQSHVVKKQRLNRKNDSPPPLPASFRDLYSSTARLSNSDDSALHGGRKRAVPHVEGNWNAHVYLEWHPSLTESSTLSSLLKTIQAQPMSKRTSSEGTTVHSLLLDPLHVPLPLHISLSAPLVLRTDTKDAFLTSMTSELQGARSRLPKTKDGLMVKPIKLAWHPNHDRTRAFLVLKVGGAEGSNGSLGELLGACNSVARDFGCPALYSKTREVDRAIERTRSRDGDNASVAPEAEVEDVEGGFHISLAWSLGVKGVTKEVTLPADAAFEAHMRMVKDMVISFSEVKIRLGKDVVSVPLSRTRQSGKGILG